MCVGPFAMSKVKQNPLAAFDPNAGQERAEEERKRRAQSGGFSADLVSTPASRSTGTAGTKLLLGQ